ncbi:MAG: right-handed parallel beta-helix repeat-containing protein [Nitrospirota bacterium]
MRQRAIKKLILLLIFFISLAPGVLWAVPPTVTNVTPLVVPYDINIAIDLNMVLFSAKVTNGNASPLQDVVVTINPLPAGYSLASGETSVRKVGTLLVGASKSVFWFVRYPRAAGTGSYSFTTTSLGQTNVTTSGSINTVSGAATASQKICAGFGPTFSSSNPIVGQTITETFRADSGNIVASQTDAYSIQGVANAVSYVGGILQFVGSTIQIFPGGTCAIPTGTSVTHTDVLYFDKASAGTPQFPDITTGQTYAIVTYQWLVVGTGSTPVNAYNSVIGPNKYNSDYGTPASSVSTPPATNTLTLAKSASPTSVPAGSNTTYTLTVSNSGGAAITLDDLVDTLPAGASYVTGSSVYTCPSPCTNNANPIISGQTLTYNGPFTVPASGTFVLTFQAAMPGSVGTHVNSAVGHIQNTQIDTTTSTTDNAPATASVTTFVAPNVTITKTTSTSSVPQGGQAIYTITVTNTGAGDASSVTVNDPLPTGFTYASTDSITGNNTRTSTSTPAVGTTTPTWGTWTIPASTGTLTITFTANTSCSATTGTKDNSPSTSGSNFTTVTFNGAGSTAENVTITAGTAGTMTVNSTSDNNTRDTVLTLREAILLSEGTLAKSALTADETSQSPGCPGAGALDTITFTSALGTISLSSLLPSITDTAGTVITGVGSTVQLTQSGLGAGSDALTLTAGLNKIQGMIIRGFPDAGIFVNSSSGTNKLFHNTFNANGTGVIVGASATVDLRNNLISNNTTTGVSGDATPGTIDYNGYFNNGSGNAHCTGGCTIGANSIKADPRYTSSSDFNLLSSSPAINRGIDLGADQPDMDGGGAPNFSQGAPDMGARESAFAAPAAASPIVSELVPITVYYTSTGIPFTWDTLPTISSTQSGIDRVALTIPSGFTAPSITSVTVSGTSLTLGAAANCPSQPDANEYCFTFASSILTVTSGRRILDTTSSQRFTVNFTLSVPGVVGNSTFTVTADDVMTTGVAAMSVSAGNANGTSANGITDNDTLTVETVDRVIVRNTSDTVSSDAQTTSAWRLVPFPGTDGISLREAIIATQAGGAANNSPIPEIIVFNTSVFPSGPTATIIPGSALPSLTDGAGVTIDAFTAPYLAGVVLDGTGLVSTIAGLDLAADNHIVRNLTFRNYGTGIALSLSTSSNNEVSKNLINNARVKGILITGGASHTIKENTVAASSGEGIDATGSPSGLMIRDNIVSSSGTFGIQICCASPINNTILNNQVTSNLSAGIKVGGGSGNIIDSNTVLNNTGGIITSASLSGTITKNLVGETSGVGITIGAGSNSAKVTINTVRNSSSDGILISANTAKVYHNTSNGNTGDGMEVGSSVTGFDVRNNIFSNNGGGGLNALDGNGSTVAYNDYFGNTLGACISGCLNGTGSITTDPIYVSPLSPTYDFHLNEPSSPAINAGFNLGATDQPDVNGSGPGTFNGANPDMGAYESSGASGTVILTVSTATPSVLAGGAATYTMNFANTGGTVASTVVGTATLPSGFTFATGSTVIGLGGGTTRSPSTPNPSGGETAPQWGTFSIPATTGTLSITFQAAVNCTVAANVYNTSGSATGSIAIPSYDGTTATLDDVTVTTGDPIIVVNTTTDGNVRNSVVSLREAILLANGALSTQALTAAERTQVSGCIGVGIRETINFDGGIFPAGAPGIIPILASSLPALTDTVGVLLDGFGKGVIVDGANATLVGLTVESNTNYMRNFTMKRFGGAAPDGVGILLSTASNNTMIDVTSRENATKGIFVSGGSGNIITTSSAISNGTIGIDITGSTTTMTTVTVTNNGGGGIKVATGTNNTITTSIISSNTGVGVEFGSNSNSLTNSTLNANTTIGVLVSGSSNTVSNNGTPPSTGITNSGTHGVSVTGNSNTAISNNTITGSTEHGMWISGDSNATVVSNIITGSGQRGLLITGSTNTATTNTINANGVGGVLIQTGTGNTVTGGTINLNTGPGVRIESNSNTISSAQVSTSTASGAIVTGNSNLLTSLTMLNNTNMGVDITGSTNTVSASTITSPTSIGVLVTVGTGNIVTTSTIDGATGAGVRFETASNTLSNSTVMNTLAGPGVLVTAGAGNIIGTSTIRSNAAIGVSLTGGTGTIIRNSRIAANTGDGVDIAGAATGSLLKINTINGNTAMGVDIAANTTTLFNNTVSNNTGTGTSIGGTVTGFDLRNNQFTNNGGAGINAPTGGTIDYNNTYGNVPSGLCVGGCALGTNAMKANPRYASPGTAHTSDFSLTTPSPAINRGVDVGEAFLSTAPDIGAVESSLTTPTVATSAIAELIPITVYWNSTGIPFVWESQPTIDASNSGVDRVNLTLPTGYSSPAVTGVDVAGVSNLVLGPSANCTPAFLPEPGEYCASTSTSSVSVIFSNRIINGTSPNRVTVRFTLNVPTAEDTGKVFISNVDDQMTSAATVGASAGNVNGVPANGITDNNTLTVTTVDTVMVRNTTDIISSDANASTGSAGLLVAYPGTDGISLREALTAVNAGESVNFFDTIDFNAGVFPSGTPATITPLSALPSIANATGTAIIALERPVTVPVIAPAGVIIDGISAGAGVAGFTMTTGNNRLLGFTVRNFLGLGISIPTGAGTGNEVSGMVIHNNGGGGISLASNSAKLFQNTIQLNTGMGVLVAAGVTGLDMRNNLITNNTTAGISSESGVGAIDYNGYFNNGAGNVHCTSGCTIGANSIKADPRYTSAATFDFSLIAASPAINRGVNLVGDQPDMNEGGTGNGNFNQGTPDMGAKESNHTTPAAATSVLAEVIPITVLTGSTAIPFVWDTLPTIATTTGSGIDKVVLTLPSGYSAPALVSVFVSGGQLSAGTTNCSTAPFLPDTTEYCVATTATTMTITSGLRIIGSTTNKNFKVNLTLSVPTSVGTGVFGSTADDQMTASVAMTASAGNANGTSSNAVTDNNTLTVTAVNTVRVSNTTNTVNGNVGSAGLLVAYPDTDGISLREALTAVEAGESISVLDTIDFTSGLGTISVATTPLPSLDDAVGTIITAVGSTVQLTQTGLAAGSDGLTLNNGSNKVLGMIIRGFPDAGIAMTGGTNKLFHNTLHGNGIGLFVGTGVLNLDARNNLITNNTVEGISAAGTVGTIDYNGYFSNGAGNAHCAGGCTIGANSIKADPRYTGATDFNLIESSPAINRGLDLGADQPDMDGGGTPNFSQGAPDMGARESAFATPAVATSAIAELIPITVYYNSTNVPFTWDSKPTISATQSGVDQVVLTLPSGFSAPAVTGVTVSGSPSLVLGSTNCTTPPNLPDTTEYCVATTASTITVTSGLRILDSTKRMTVNFTLTVPATANAGQTFAVVVDDAMTSAATVGATAGSANLTPANGITDNNTLTVTTVDKLIVRTTNDTINGSPGSVALLVSDPGDDGISLREALTAVNSGASIGVIDTIDFVSTLGTITVTGSVLPPIADTAGTIITGVGSTVQLTQTGLAASSDGLTLTAGANKILGMIVRGFPDGGIVMTGGTNKIFHNTLYVNGTAIIVGAGVTGLDVRNNLITSNTTAGISSAPGTGIINYNAYSDNGGSGNAHCTGGCLIGVNSIKADPRYTNASAFNFSLSEPSPAINRGLDLGSPDQPDMNGGGSGNGNYNSDGPDMGARESAFSTPAVASSALSELTPITVYFGSTAIPFMWDVLPAITASQSGVDQITLTLPTGYSAPSVTGVTVSVSPLVAGTTNCTTAPNLPDNNEYCVSVAGSVVTVTSGLRVNNASGNKRMTVSLTLTVPAAADSGLAFPVSVDDAMTSASTVSATAGNANTVAGNTVTDNDTLTVTTVDKVVVSNTTDTMNGQVTSVYRLVAFPGTDGISLREALTAANSGASIGVADTINFSASVFSTSSPATITVTGSPLPAIADPAGTTLTALSPLAGVILTQSGLPAGTAGLTLSAGTNRISRLEIKSFPGNGITVSGGSGSVIESSLIRSNGGVGISLTGVNHKLFHLTINGNTGNGITNADATTEIKNSLITNNGGFGISSPAATIDYSGFFGNPSGDCTGGCTIGAASIPLNPSYTNASGGDFTLLSTSHMINMGVNLGGSQPDQNNGTVGLFNGNFPDMGRYETNTATTTPSVAITKTTSTPVVNGGGPATYTITLSNTGARGARGVTVTDTLPTGFTYTSTGTIGGSATRTSVTDPTAGSGTPTWAAWYIPTGGNLTITFTAAATAPQGFYDNNVSATSIDVTIASFTGAQIQVLGYNVSGVVFVDSNHNGALDLAEAGILSVTLRIFSGASPIATTTTDSAGKYIFTGIANGTYEVRETVPALYSPTTATIFPITINNAHITGQNFGNFAGMRITGTVFSDIGLGGGTPNNGIKDGTEAGISNTAVRVTDTGGGTLYDQTVTSQSGIYTLWVPTATTLSVVVRETNPSNYVSITPDTIALSVSAGVDSANHHFGDVPPLSFSPNGSQVAAPGSIAVFAHTLVAGTTGQVTLSTTSSAGLIFTFYKDTNGNTQLDVGEPLLTAGDLNMTASQTLKFLARAMIPTSFALGTVNTAVITALQVFVNSSLTDSRMVTDLTHVSSGAFRLVKSGSVTTAKPGENIIYTLTYINMGAETLSSIVIHDRLSEYLTFVSATPPQDDGFPDAASVLQWTISGTLVGGASGSLSYTVTVK